MHFLCDDTESADFRLETSTTLSDDGEPTATINECAAVLLPDRLDGCQSANPAKIDALSREFRMLREASGKDALTVRAYVPYEDVLQTNWLHVFPPHLWRNVRSRRIDVYNAAEFARSVLAEAGKASGVAVVVRSIADIADAKALAVIRKTLKGYDEAGGHMARLAKKLKGVDGKSLDLFRVHAALRAAAILALADTMGEDDLLLGFGQTECVYESLGPLVADVRIHAFPADCRQPWGS